MVPQPADAIDIYVGGSAVRKRKGVARYDTGPGHQIRADRKTVIAKEEIGELTRFAFEFGQSSLAAEDHCPVARDREDNSRWLWQRLLCDQDRWAERAGAVIDLSLRQIERVFTLN